jgi:hypothetical protein
MPGKPSSPRSAAAPDRGAGERLQETGPMSTRNLRDVAPLGIAVFSPWQG